MKLSTIIAQARSGELRKASDSAIKDSDIVNYINLGVTALYGRFQLKTEEAIIALQDGITSYSLTSDNPYVTVAGQPIDDDTMLQILKVFDENGEVTLNKDKDKLSVFTVGYDTIQVPETSTGSYLSVVYKAAPPFTVYSEDINGNTEEAVVRIPVVTLEALLEYISYKAFDVIGIGENASANSLGKFEMACKKLEEYGLVPYDDLNSNNKGGFIL